MVEGDPPTLVSGCSPPWFCRQIQGAQLVNPAKLIIRSGCEVKVSRSGECEVYVNDYQVKIGEYQVVCDCEVRVSD